MKNKKTVDWDQKLHEHSLHFYIVQRLSGLFLNTKMPGSIINQKQLSGPLNILPPCLENVLNVVLSSILHVKDEDLMGQEAAGIPAHKIDENLWKNREQMEEILFLLNTSRLPAAVSLAF